MPIDIRSKFIDSEMATDAELAVVEDKFENIFVDTKEPSGFIDRTSSTISFDESTRTLSISPVSGSFSIYIQGVKYTISSTLTKQIPDTSGSYFFYINQSSELNYLSAFDISLFTTAAYVAYVLWDENDNKAVSFAEERHGITMDGATHSYLHTTRGTQLVSGAAIGFTATGDGSSNTHAQVSISDCSIRDEDISIQITNNASPSLPFQQVLSPIAQLPIYYRQNSTWRKSTATQYPVSQGTTRARYNKNTANVWSLEEASADGKVLVSYVFATNNINEPIIVLLGQDEYSDVNDALTRAAWDQISFGDLPAQEIKLLYILIYETNSTFTNTPKCAIREVRDLRFGADREVSAASLNSDHSNLSGLSNDDHLQYLLVSGLRSMSGNLDMGGNSISNVLNVDGVDVSSHAARHLPNGADALTTGTPSSTGSANSAGVANAFARQDHVHNTVLVNQQATATANTTTTSTTDVLLNSMSITASESGTYLVQCSTSVTHGSNNAITTISIYANGVLVAGSQRAVIARVANNNYQHLLGTFAIVTVAAGQVIDARWRTTAGTATAQVRSINIIRLG